MVEPSQVEQFIETLHDAFIRNAMVFVVGNGGSAANASHLAQDLAKGTCVDLSQEKRLRAKLFRARGQRYVERLALSIAHVHREANRRATPIDGNALVDREYSRSRTGDLNVKDTAIGLRRIRNGHLPAAADTSIVWGSFCGRALVSI